MGQILLGNLTVTQIEERLGVPIPKELREYMEPRRQAIASNVKPGKWHCFDFPFVLVCGDMETAKEIYEHLAPFSADIKEQLQISVNPEGGAS